MPLRIFNADTLNIRINVLNTVLTTDQERSSVAAALREANGDLSLARPSLERDIPELLPRVTLAYELADLSEDNEAIVRAIASTPDIRNLRDVALNFNVARLAAIVDPKTVPDTITAENYQEKPEKFARVIQHNLFRVEPTAVLQRMVQEEEVPIADTNVRTGVVNFLANQPEFNIRTISVYTALRNEAAFTNIAEEQREEVVNQLKTLQRVQATFNVDDETSSELLAQPQHTNYQAYCILKSAVYPFTLPYHQPIDAIRIFLTHFPHVNLSYTCSIFLGKSC